MVIFCTCMINYNPNSLFCEILIAGFWAPMEVPELFSPVSCMRSLMMACLSTEPAGAPGRVSGKSCGNWLFCRSSRISSKLSNSLPGCKGEKNTVRFVVNMKRAQGQVMALEVSRTTGREWTPVALERLLSSSPGIQKAGRGITTTMEKGQSVQPSLYLGNLALPRAHAFHSS